MKFIRLFPALLLAMLGLSGALAQGAQVAFGGLRHDSSLPVEITADQLRIDQQDGTAVFAGNVLVGQGEMRLSAGQVRVEYVAPDGQATGRIARLLASGGVTLVNGAEAAEAQQAEYRVEEGIIIMTGNVILTQGANALSAERMVVDLNSGQATMEGRVRTILAPQTSP